VKSERPADGRYCTAPLLYAGPIRVVFLLISFTVAAFSSEPRFHLCSWMRSFIGAEPGIRSEVGAGRGFLSHPFVTRGLEVAPFKGRACPMPSLRLVFSRARAAFSLASRFLCASDFTLRRRRNRFIDWFNALLCVVLYAVDCPAHCIRLHEICIVGAQHGPQFVEIGTGAKPSIIVLHHQ
jgi:hypothetical protein